MYLIKSSDHEESRALLSFARFDKKPTSLQYHTKDSTWGLGAISSFSYTVDTFMFIIKEILSFLIILFMQKVYNIYFYLNVLPSERI